MTRAAASPKAGWELESPGLHWPGVPSSLADGPLTGPVFITAARHAALTGNSTCYLTHENAPRGPCSRASYLSHRASRLRPNRLSRRQHRRPPRRRNQFLDRENINGTKTSAGLGHHGQLPTNPPPACFPSPPPRNPFPCPCARPRRRRTRARARTRRATPRRPGRRMPAASWSAPRRATSRRPTRTRPTRAS